MYHKHIIAKKQSALEASLGHPLVRYPVNQSRFYVDHLESLTIRDSKGRATGYTRQLLPDETAFIKNERLLCSIDFLYWANRYHWIQDVITKERILFNPNKAQRIMLLVLAEMEGRGVPLAIQSLKARQLGVSTLYEAMHLHRFLFKPNTHTIIASSDEDKSWMLIDTMMAPSLARQPFWLVPHDIQTWSTGELFAMSDKMNSAIYVQHGRQKIGIGRGTTPTSWHFTELFEWVDAEGQLKDAFEHGVHYSKDTFGVKESTAKGRNNFWHDLWRFNEANYPKRLSLEAPVFLPYFVGSDIYPPPGFTSAIPVPEDWTPPDYALEHKDRCETYARTSDLLSSALGENWEMPIEQLWWYTYSYERAKSSREGLGPFLSEVPASPDEAFQSPKGTIFTIELLQSLRSGCSTPIYPPLGISGSQIPVHVEPNKMEVTGPACLKLNYTYRNYKLDWELYPTPFTSYEEVLDPHNRLWIWEEPRKNHEYVVSMDDADGIEKDRTVIQVVRLGSPHAKAEQVAEFASDTLSALDIWPIYLLLLSHYTPNNVLEDQNEALCAPEINRGGKATISELMKMGWNNFYIRKDLTRVHQTTNVITQLGWNTNESSRVLLINWFMKFVKGGHIKINSPWLVDEMRDFVANEKIRTVRLEAGKGAHDDRVMALAIGLVAGHELDVPGAEVPYWMAVAEKIKDETKLPDHEAFIAGLYSLEVPKSGVGKSDKELEQIIRQGYDPNPLY